MKKRTPGFLSEENIPHNSEVFSYIQELHDYLWKFTRIAKPNVSGIIDNFVDSAVDELAALRAERDEAVRLLKEIHSMNNIANLNDAELWNVNGEFEEKIAGIIRN